VAHCQETRAPDRKGVSPRGEHVQMATQARTALVTGANQGLGLETCRQLAAEGFHVILTSRDEKAGTAAATKLAGDGLPVAYRRLDVSDADNVAALADALAGEGRRIDVLVNNAAVEFDGFNADVARDTLAVNVYGAAEVPSSFTGRLKTISARMSDSGSGGLLVSDSCGASAVP
jgi:carbonyl reductase 1